MNIDEIISQLNYNEKIEPVPDGHYILHREDNYRENILPDHSIRLSGKIEDTRETNVISSIEDFLWICDGDSTEFPRDIDSSIEEVSY